MSQIFSVSFFCEMFNCNAPWNICEKKTFLVKFLQTVFFPHTFSYFHTFLQFFVVQILLFRLVRSCRLLFIFFHSQLFLHFPSLPPFRTPPSLRPSVRPSLPSHPPLPHPDGIKWSVQLAN